MIKQLTERRRQSERDAKSLGRRETSRRFATTIRETRVCRESQRKRRTRRNADKKLVNAIERGQLRDTGGRTPTRCATRSERRRVSSTTRCASVKHNDCGTVVSLARTSLSFPSRQSSVVDFLWKGPTVCRNLIHHDMYD